MTSEDNRSVTARDITGTSVVTGDNNTVITWMTQHLLPPPETVNAATELIALRELIGTLNAPDRSKLDRAMQDVTEEAAKPNPDKEEVAGALGRVIKYAEAADNFSEHAEKLLPRVLALGSWLGIHGVPLLSIPGFAG